MPSFLLSLQAKLIAAGVALAALTGAFLWHKVVVGERDTAVAKLAPMTAALQASEQARKTEQGSNADAATKTQAECESRIVEARRTASAIKSIVETGHASKPPIAGSATSEPLISAGELRDTFQPQRNP